jgi:predicted Abi (CAAX) family protease
MDMAKIVGKFAPNGPKILSGWSKFLPVTASWTASPYMALANPHGGLLWTMEGGQVRGKDPSAASLRKTKILHEVSAIY